MSSTPQVYQVVGVCVFGSNYLFYYFLKVLYLNGLWLKGTDMCKNKALQCKLTMILLQSLQEANFIYSRQVGRIHIAYPWLCLD